MMRAFFITTCVLSLIFIVTAFRIAADVRSAEFDTWLYNDYNSYSDPYGYDSGYSYSYDDSYEYEQEAEDGTRMGGIVTIFYMLISVAAFLLALLKIKTKTMKVIGIIGLSFAGIFLLWAFLPVASPDAISFSEVGPAFGLAGIALLGLHIVGIIHAFKTST